MGVKKLPIDRRNRPKPCVGVIMELVIKGIRWLVLIVLAWGVIACSDSSETVNVPIAEGPVASEIRLDVYKSPSCGCCGKWVTHVEASGFKTVLHHPNDLNKLKADKGISPRYQSCHTAISLDGYVFEGHISADIIHRFLAHPPADTLGLAVPGMPAGSPGMEMGSRYEEYDILLLGKDDSNTIFEHIDGNR
jgi:hypothetical protein